MQPDLRSPSSLGGVARDANPLERQTEIVRTLTAQAVQAPDDLELRERLREALHRIDVLVRRRDGWSDDGKPPPASAR